MAITTQVHSTEIKLKTYKTAKQEALNFIIGRREGKIKSLVTPWEKYNRAHLDGLEDRKIVTIAGMSSSGKSLIAGELESKLHELNPHEDFAILSYNFEMPSMEIILRGITAKTGISSRELLSAEGIQIEDGKLNMVKLLLEQDDLKKEIYYVEYPKTVEQYKNICREFYKKYKKRFVTISDHSILFKRGVSDNSVTDTLYALGDASMELKKELPIIQIHLSQLNREIEKPERRVPCNGLNYPSKDCLFGSDGLYQCADTVLINHRPYLLNFKPNTYGPNKLPCGPNDLYWHYCKLRNGDPHVAAMTADFANMKILDKL
jgi:replicative DNA helicase